MAAKFISMRGLKKFSSACAVTHQRGFTKQFASSDQIANGDMKVGVSAAPVGDLCEGVGGQDVLVKNRRALLLRLKTENLGWTLLAPTFVLGSIRLTPCLLMAISRISGKLGSVVC